MNRRKLLTAASIVVLITGSLIAASAALAVHTDGLFELDTTATAATCTPLPAPCGNANTADSPAGGADDWANVYKSATGLGTAGADHAFARTFITDLVGAAENDYYTGGGSKDVLDIPNWQYGTTNDPVPDKDDIANAFAAAYHATTGADAGHTIIYFGMDRFDNNGDSETGFWFFKSPVSLNGSGGFTGIHTAGDLLVLADWGGSNPVGAITVYSWVGGKNPLVQITNNLNGDCANASVSPPDNVCAVVNRTSDSQPWPFTDKSGSATIRPLELFEAGLDLNDLLGGDQCFASFLAATRSSHSTTAQLKDFALGQFENCTPTLTTTPSATVASPVTPGTSVTDTLVVQGSGVASPPPPTGTVTFFLCGPIASGTCSSGGTNIGTGTLADTNPPPGEATAISPAVDTAASVTGVLAPGRYCFRSEWPGDNTYKPVPPATKFVEFGTGDSECFAVAKIPTTTVTTPSDSSGTALSGTQALGASLYDKAVVTGTAAGGNPTGTVAFFVCSGAQLTGGAGAEVCAAGDGTALSGNPRTLAPVPASTSASFAISSPAVVASIAGVYCFRATYTPTGNIYTGSNDTGNHAECVTVGPEATSTKTTPQVNGSPIIGSVAFGTIVTDHAVVTATDSVDGTPTGTIDFFVCNPTVVASNGGTCSAGGVAAGSVTAQAVALSNPPASFGDSDNVTASVVGTWCFRAVYTPGGANGANYTGSSDSSTGECFAVTDTTTTSTAQDWLPNDTATISSVGGTALNGNVAFTLHDGAGCSGTVLYSSLTNAVSGSSPQIVSTSNTTIKVTSSGTVSWEVVYTSNNANVSGSNSCETTVLTITN